jgi:uncharacterized membrane protein YqjE
MIAVVDRLQELTSRLAEQVQALVRIELKLAQAEMTDKAKLAARAAAMGAVAGVLAFFAVFGLLIAAIWGLGELMPIWASALIVAAVFLLVAAVIGMMAMKRAKRATPPIPAAAIQTAKPIPEEMGAAYKREAAR